MKAEAYLSGVLHGDGWCTKTLGLRVKDRDFAEAFADAIEKVAAKRPNIIIDERGYFTVRVSNKTGKFSYLKDSEIRTAEDKASWLRGLFDSEGNASLRNLRDHSFERRIGMYSTSVETLLRAKVYLTDLGMTTAFRMMKNSRGHKGSKTVHELKLRGSIENFSLFAKYVGSSIMRKHAIIEAIPLSYQPDHEYLRRAQLKGVAAKRRKGSIR